MSNETLFLLSFVVFIFFILALDLGKPTKRQAEEATPCAVTNGVIVCANKVPQNKKLPSPLSFKKLQRVLFLVFIKILKDNREWVEVQKKFKQLTLHKSYYVTKVNFILLLTI